FIDPYVATGYEYEVVGSKFATIQIPNSYGDGQFNVYYWDGSAWVAAGTIGVNDPFNFLAIDPNGFSKIKIDGIEIAAAVDPTDPLAFITGITLASGGSGISITQTALETCDGAPDCAAAIPEPHIFLLFGTGLFSLVYARRRAIKKA
ncbi:MAG: PEP-CTERM sorting domain-containing protein, partial [Gammaproteobacteria bacterium]|nr:PEP-CTERM sorting domain-containing protein [Gammaproteobacteria bacterium]